MLDIGTTSQWVRIIVKPKPSLRALRVLRQRRPALPRPPYPYIHQAKQALRRDCYYVEQAREADIRINMHTEVSTDAAGSVYSSFLPTVVEEPAYSSSSSDDSSCEYTSSSCTSSSSGGFSPFLEPGSPRVLRSYRHRKCKSISEIETAFLQIKDGGEQRYRRSHTWPRTRTNRSLSWILASESDPYDEGQQQQQSVSPMGDRDDTGESDGSREIWRIKDPVQRFSDPRIWLGVSPPAPPSPPAPAPQELDTTRFTDFTQYYTAHTSFHNTSLGSGGNGDGDGEGEGEEVQMQAVDRESGVFFQRICGSDGADLRRFDQLRDAGCSDELAYQLVPSRWAAQTAILQSTCHQSQGSSSSPDPFAALYRQEQEMGQGQGQGVQPSIVLTVPTPMIQQSPAFATHSPITLEKFFGALEGSSGSCARTTPVMLSTTPSPSPSPYPLGTTTHMAPPLPSCGLCGLAEFEAGTECRACAERWLACKVWYRHCGAEGKGLAPPYVRPAECNKRNRRVMRGLGVPGCGEGEGEGEGEVGTGEEKEKDAKSSGWRLFRYRGEGDKGVDAGTTARDDDDDDYSDDPSSSSGVRAAKLKTRPLRALVELSKTLALSLNLGLGLLWMAVVSVVSSHSHPHSHSPSDPGAATASDGSAGASQMLGATQIRGIVPTPTQTQTPVTAASPHAVLPRNGGLTRFVEHLDLDLNNDE